MKMYKTTREYFESVYYTVSYNFSVSIEWTSDKEKVAKIVDELISLLDDKEVKSFIKDMDALNKSYSNSFEYEEGLYSIWNKHLEMKYQG